MQDRVTIREVAAQANVHASTVSRVLRNPSGRATPSRDQIIAAVHQLGYQPNLLARALSANKAPIVPLLIPDVANWFFAEVARGAEEAAWEAGLSLVLCNTGIDTARDPQRERVYLESLVQLQVPFAIVAPNSESSGDMIREISKRCPIVTIDRLIEGLDIPGVTVDNELGGRLAARHLLGLGHRHVACIAGPSGASTARARVRGFQEVFADAGCEPVVIQGGFLTKDGVAAANEFLGLKDRPTAVFAANDLCAIAFIHVLERHDVHVPGDVSVVGFDDLVFAAYLRPSLTSIHQPARRLGSLAVELALDSRNRRTSPIKLRPRLIARESTARPQ